MKKTKAHENINIMYIISILGGFLFFLPILALYFEKELFSVTNVAIIFAIEALGGVIFEMPTGALADLFGRKKTMIYAQILVLLALIFLYIGGSMFFFVMYAILNAFAVSLASGTQEAILYDSLQEVGEEKKYKKVNGIYNALWPIGASIGSIIGGYLAAISLELTISLTAIPISLTLFCLFFLAEPKYEKEEHTNVFKHIKESSKIIVHSKNLIVIFFAMFTMMALGESVHLLTPIFFEFKEIPLEYFGWITALTFGFSSIGFYLSHKLSEKLGDKATLLIVTTLSPLMVLGATFMPAGFFFVALWTIPSIFFGIKHPIISHLLNEEVSSSKRATVISINNFMGKLGMAIITPFFGYYADIISIQAAIQLSAVLVLIVPIIFVFYKGR